MKENWHPAPLKYLERLELYMVEEPVAILEGEKE